MPSFEKLLRQTMPIAGVEDVYTGVAMSQYDADHSAGPPPTGMPSLLGGEPIACGAVKVVRLELDESWTVDKPEIEPSDYEEPHDVSIWRWSHDATAPWVVGNVWCRMRSADYRSHLVAHSIEWGLETGDTKGVLKNCIRITTMAGTRIELPLTKDFVAYKAVVEGGKIVDDQTDLWKLPANLDQSLVIALIYSLEPNQPPKPMTADDADDLGDDFMGEGGAGAQSGADVHGETSAELDHPRVLVILSLTTCKQSEDFAPGAVVGTGRIYPHIMVMSSAPLARIEATVRLNRPEKTTRTKDAVTPPDDIGDKYVSFFKGPKGCCSIYDEDQDADEPDINAVLFADANDMDLSPLSPPPPFWGNFFSYYLLNVYPSIKDETVLAVSRDQEKWKTRSRDGLVVRQVVTGPKDYQKLIKLPCQGEFDNIHQAPRMVLRRVAKVVHAELTRAEYGNGVRLKTHDVPAATLHLDEISMAPFCSHDCLHTHWRWGKQATDKGQLGFQGMVPYSKAGAPLVPDNQTVQVWLRDKNLLTYTATVWAQGQRPIGANQWQVIMHHGSAYALDITAYVMAFMAKLSIDMLGGEPQFYEADGTKITCTMSFSLFYWKLRWETVLVDGKPQLQERVSIANLDASRAL